MKLVILDHHALNPGDMDLTEFRSFGEVIVYPRSKPEEVVERISDAEMIFINKVVIDRKVMDACPNLKYVGVMATGYNVVDIEAARERGIVVTNIPDYSTESVAQFTFALMLARANRVYEHSASVHRIGHGNACSVLYTDTSSGTGYRGLLLYRRRYGISAVRHRDLAFAAHKG